MLEKYEVASGQFLNKDKTSIYFSANIPKEVRSNVLQIASVRATSTFEKYVDLPTIVGANKAKSFHNLLDKLWAKISNWKTQHLSAVGKEILIKGVPQAIRTYTMEIFKLPRGINTKLNSLLRKFWWGVTAEKGKIHWLT